MLRGEANSFGELLLGKVIKGVRTTRELRTMDLLGVIVILLVACLTVASVCLGLVICALITLRRQAKKRNDT